MPKIDGVTYPDGLKAMLKDRVIGPLYRAFLDKIDCAEIYVFMDETAKKRDPKSQYKKFFTSRGRYSVNIDGKALEKAKSLGEKEDWKSREWEMVYDAAEAKTMDLANGEHNRNFYRNDPAFKQHHVHMLEKQILTKKYPALLVDLDTDDKKAVAKVAALLKADKRAGEKAVVAFTKKTKSTRSPRDVSRKIKDFFGIR
ncbi:hypothetical protein [Arenibacterium sp. LLYu02]|uniref:hypothetical protein n=1 Tax=Arenibacterium sp. LLYu02 TaxID=3404132 RepID=UPI003B215FFD